MKQAVVAAELERIRKMHGGKLRASDVVEEASDPDSPIHDRFEWDDAAAAHEHRLRQARVLIRVVPVAPGKSERKYVNIRAQSEDEPEGYYRPLHNIHQSPDEWSFALVDAKRRLSSAQQGLDELLDQARADKKPKQTTALILMAAEALRTANEALSKTH